MRNISKEELIRVQAAMKRLELIEKRQREIKSKSESTILEKQELIRLEQEHQVHENIIFPNEK